MKCTNPDPCTGQMKSFSWLDPKKVECEKCGYRTDAKEEAPKKAKKETEIKENE